MQETQETQVQSLGQEDSPGGGNGNPFQHPCLGKFHGQRSLVGYSPRDHKESDMTKHAHIAKHGLTTPTMTKFKLLA